MSESNLEIDKYFQELGVKSYKNILQFWSAIDEEYGMTRARQLESSYIKLQEGDEAAFYSTIFEEYDVGIAFCGLRINLYHAFLSWLVGFMESKTPETIFDIGCGNGVLTCLYAKLFPDAQIVGFDISKEGIESSNILKKRLKLKNVEFVVCDVKEKITDQYKEKADIVISVASLDPRMEDSTKVINQSLDSLCKSIEAETNLEPLNAVCSLLKDMNSALISFDKVKTLTQQLRRINSFYKAGMQLDYLDSSWISYQDIEQEKIELPCFVLQKSEDRAILQESLTFLTNRSSKILDLELTDQSPLEAELVFTYLNPKNFVKGARADYRDGTGSIWHEVWQCGPLIFMFEHSNHGFRGLTFRNLLNTNEVLEEHEKWINQSKNYADVEILTEPEIDFSPLSCFNEAQ